MPSKHRHKGAMKGTRGPGSGMYHASILARQAIPGTRPDTMIYADHVPVIIVGNVYPTTHIRCRCSWGDASGNGEKLYLRFRFLDCPVKLKNGHE
jgi:hypothetical protein